MSPHELISAYAQGPQLLRAATRGLSRDQALARPVPGRWSTLECVCHIADFELVYADRLKRVLAEDGPTLFGGDPDRFAAALAYQQRELSEELDLIESCRLHVVRILRTIPESAWQRIGRHSEAGPLSLQTLLERVTGHIPHHAAFIAAKRAALGC